MIQSRSYRPRKHSFAAQTERRGAPPTQKPELKSVSIGKPPPAFVSGLLISVFLLGLAFIQKLRLAFAVRVETQVVRVVKSTP